MKHEGQIEMRKLEYALITGGGSGIGLEFAKLLLPKYNLVLLGRDKEKLIKAKEDLLKQFTLGSSREIILLPYDLSELSAAASVFQACQQKSIDIKILINNAGCGLFGYHESLDETKITKMLNLNIITLTLLCKFFGEEMKREKSGYILNIASLAAYQPVPYIAAYAASKSYVLNFSEGLSKELEDYNVTVTCLSPGHTDTNFFAYAGIGNKKEGFYGLNTRISPAKVAQIGINALFSQRLSVIPGIKNNILANINRFSPRLLTANISKYLTQKELNKERVE
jgi:short-subunit dehydrogenase